MALTLACGGGDAIAPASEPAAGTWLFQTSQLTGERSTWTFATEGTFEIGGTDAAPTGRLITGSETVNGFRLGLAAAPLAGLSIDGDRIRFSLGASYPVFAGRRSGDTMTGTVWTKLLTDSGEDSLSGTWTAGRQ